jgi:pSer/pThr/pTyr-binding forkhead associated (FHA) protein
MHSNNPTLRERHFLLLNNGSRELISLTQNAYHIGRSLANEIVLEGNPISRIHSRLHRTDRSPKQSGGYYLLDGAANEKPSKNGIFVNNVRCNCHLLQNGDVISFANIIEALYLKRDLNEDDFERFQETVRSDLFVLSAFREDQRESRLGSQLSNLEFTTILLGGTSVRSKETIGLTL